MTTKLLQQALLKNKKSKNILQKGFTLVELMVVIVVVGILSAVALPALNGAQERAYASNAKQLSVQHAKACSFEVIGDGTVANADVAEVAAAPGVNISNRATTCAADAAYAFTGGGTTWTTTLNAGIPGVPEKS